MSHLKMALVSLIAVFDNYAGKKGDKKTLTKAEMKELLQNELPELLGKSDDKAAVDMFFNELDMDKDNSVDFPEFLHLIGALAVDLHNTFAQL